jgi:hypothetical protein
LAFIGGGTSDRAVELARALADKTDWHGRGTREAGRPLLLITTATANSILLDPPEDGPALPQPKPLMHIYPDRSFRFCFTNRQMAQAVVDFLGTQPDLRPSGDPWPALAAVGQAAAGPWGAWPLLAVQSAEYPPGANALVWDDDPYSIDLAAQFHQAFHRPEGPRVLMRERRSIPYSVGDFDRPNAWESLAADYLLRDLRANPLERQVLVLPAAAPARRVLRALSGALPLVGRYLVAVSGDSISVNTVYRDAELAWNIRALPVPLVFFTHQNPVAWDDDPASRERQVVGLSGGKVVEDRDRPTTQPPNHPTTQPPDAPGSPEEFTLKPPTATDDVLLHGELVRMLAEAAYRFPGDAGPVPPGAEAPPGLIDSAAELARRLRGRRPAFFDPDGDRVGGRGEYVIALRPKIIDAGGSAQVAPEATLEVWTREGPAVAGRPAAEWKLVKRLVINHGRSLPAALP